MSTEIRNAQVSAAGQDPLVRADPNDIVVRNVSATGTASLIRYCLSETTRSIFRETAPDGTTPSAGCPSTSGTWNSKQISAGAIANSATDPIFTPNTTTLAAVRSVGIAIRVDTGTAGHTTRLGTGVSLRSASGRPLNLDPSAIGFTCATDGSKTALLDLLVATDPSGGPLQAAISTAAGVSIGSISAGATASIAASVQGALRIVVTNPLGIQQVLFKTVTCP